MVDHLTNLGEEGMGYLVDHQMDILGPCDWGDHETVSDGRLEENWGVGVDR